MLFFCFFLSAWMCYLLKQQYCFFVQKHELFVVVLCCAVLHLEKSDSLVGVKRKEKECFFFLSLPPPFPPPLFSFLFPVKLSSVLFCAFENFFICLTTTKQRQHKKTANSGLKERERSRADFSFKEN